MEKNKFKNILRGLYIFVLGGFCFIALYLILFPTYSNQIEGGYFQEYLQNNDYKIDLGDFDKKIGEGASMYPTIPDNSISLIVRDEIHKGDIIIFVNLDKTKFGDYEYIQHRVIDIRIVNGEIQYLTRGDNLKFSDGWISQENVVGKVVGILY